MLKNAQAIHLDTLIGLVNSYVTSHDDTWYILACSENIVSNKKHLMLHNKSVNKRFKVVYNKRRLLPDFSTLPYGYWYDDAWVRDTSEFDFRLIHPFSCVISGPSNSSKTYFVKRLMENGLNMISEIIENVYVYNCWQPLYKELLKLYPIKFVEGIPESLNDDHLLPANKASILILDDSMAEASGNIEVQKLFTQYVHHHNLSTIYIVQNWFTQGKLSRTISLNTSYLILFKNPHDTNQVMLLGRQIYPSNVKYFMECYQDTTSQPYGYLMKDYKAKTPEQYRLRTGLLSPPKTRC